MSEHSSAVSRGHQRNGGGAALRFHDGADRGYNLLQPSVAGLILGRRERIDELLFAMLNPVEHLAEAVQDALRVPQRTGVVCQRFQ